MISNPGHLDWDEYFQHLWVKYLQLIERWKRSSKDKGWKRSLKKSKDKKYKKLKDARIYYNKKAKQANDARLKFTGGSFGHKQDKRSDLHKPTEPEATLEPKATVEIPKEESNDGVILVCNFIQNILLLLFCIGINFLPETILRIC